MTSRTPKAVPTAPSNLADAAEIASEQVAAARADAGPSVYRPPLATKWRGGYMAVLFLAQFTMSIAQLAPSTYSLAVRVQQLSPAGKTTALALVLTIPAIAIILVNPIVGILSDQTRSRLGRRRPWMIGGLTAGLVGLTVVGLAPGIAGIIVGWTIGYLGLTISSTMVLTHFGDALPYEQRGKVAGINGAVTQVGPIAGILLSGALVQMSFLLFFIPGLIAVLGSIAFLIRMKDPSTKGAHFERLPLLGVFRHMVFNPRKHRDFSWVWISKAATFIALYMMSIYTVYFLADRLHLSSSSVAGVIAISGGAGILFAMAGALAGGFISDKIKRRKPLIVIAGGILAVGLLTIALCTSTTQYIIGSIILTLGTGVFGAVDQAIALDVLPSAESTGRFLGISQLANEIPKAIAPIIAAIIVGIGAGNNFQIVYFVAAALALAGGLLVLPVRKTR